MHPYLTVALQTLAKASVLSFQDALFVLSGVGHSVLSVAVFLLTVSFFLSVILHFLERAGKPLRFSFGAFNGNTAQPGSPEIAANNINVEPVKDCPVRFSDVAGIEEIKADLLELVSFLQTPDQYTAYGAKLPRGVLLSGPPGTGKTLLAKAIAGESGSAFISLSASELVEVFVGVGAARLRKVFEAAKANSPCIIFIDEIDAIGRKRSGAGFGADSEREQTLIQLLTLLDGFVSNDGVTVIAATNKPEVLDEALLRAGRFDRKLTLRLPDKADREQILRVHSADRRLAPDIAETWLTTIARKTTGCTGADLANILNEAAIAAAGEQSKGIEERHLSNAIDRVLTGLNRPHKGMSDAERRTLAVHEAGHAIVIAALSPVSDVGTPEKVTIVGSGDADGYTLSFPVREQVLTYQKDYRARIVSLMAGRAAESLWGEDISLGAQDDYRRASALADSLIRNNAAGALLGPLSNQRSLSETSAREIELKVERLLSSAYKTARFLLISNKALAVMMIDLLEDEETLEGETLKELLDELKMPPLYGSVVKWLSTGSFNPAIDSAYRQLMHSEHGAANCL